MAADVLTKCIKDRENAHVSLLPYIAMESEDVICYIFETVGATLKQQ